MNENDLIISETEWFFYLSVGKSYQGYVFHRDGNVSYVLPEITVSNDPINDFGDLTEYTPLVDTAYRTIDVTEEFNDFFRIDNERLQEPISVTVGRQLNIWGKNKIGTRQKFQGATKGTSEAAIFFRYKTPLGITRIPPYIQSKMPKKIGLSSPKYHIKLRTDNWGALAGRFTPVVGHGLVVYGVALSSYSIYKADNKPKAIVTEAGGWVGAWAGLQTGAWVGGTVGSFFGGVGVVPGSIIGGIIGSTIGFWGGSTVSEATYEVVERQY